MTLKTTTTQVVETSVTVNDNSPVQDCVHPDDHTQPTNEMTPGFKPFTVPEVFVKVSPAQFPSVSLRRTHLELSLNVHLREMIESQIKGLRKVGTNFRRVVTKISSCRVNATSRRGIKRLGISFDSIFLLFSNKSSRGSLS